MRLHGQEATHAAGVPPAVLAPHHGRRPRRAGADSVGITKERVERLTRTEGKPGGCGCEGRKRWMNEQGVRVQKAVRDASMAAKHFYYGK